MRDRHRFWAGVLSLGALGAAWSVTAAAQEPKPSPPPSQPTPAAVAGDQSAEGMQTVEGVITRIEGQAATQPGAANPKGEAKNVRLTINTSVVWQDYVRDQSTIPHRTGEADDTKAGENSVALKGHPESPDSLVQVELAPAAQILGRFRASTEADTEGEDSPAAAANSAQAPGAPDASHKADRPTPLEAKDLKRGQYVRVHFRKVEDRNQIAELFVLRPVGGPDTPPDKADNRTGQPAPK